MQDLEPERSGRDQGGDRFDAPAPENHLGGIAAKILIAGLIAAVYVYLRPA